MTEQEQAVVKADFEAQLQEMQDTGRISGYSVVMMPWGASVSVSVGMPPLERKQ